jgi:hypothetical protein
MFEAVEIDAANDSVVKSFRIGHFSAVTLGQYSIIEYE